MKITGVHKEDGTITNYKLDNGKIIDKEECISLVKDGKIEDCNIGVNKQNQEFVRTNRDDEGSEGKHITNLDNLPQF